MANNEEYCESASYQMIYRMLDKLRKRPGVWLGKPDITKLNTFISGYYNALWDLDVYANKTTLFPLDFWFMHEFVKNKTKSYGSSAGWANLILEECKGNEIEAIERFFEYLYEFRSLKAVSMKKAILTDENILANDKMMFSYKVDTSTIFREDENKADNEYYYIGEKLIGRKIPVYDSPQAVYIIELSGKNGFLCAIETVNDIRVKRYIFGEKQIMGNNKCSESPENVFGSLTTLNTIPCFENPDFNKPIYW